MPRAKTKLKPAAVLFLVAIAVVAYWLDQRRGAADDGTVGSGSIGNAAIGQAFEERRSGVWVTGEGEIVHLLPDDRRPPRHQLFLVELTQGHTIKISHNVDLAPQVPVQKGSRISFRGRFEFNDKGGVVHWTHRDPSGRKPGGWLEYLGKTYK